MRDFRKSQTSKDAGEDIPLTYDQILKAATGENPVNPPVCQGIPLPDGTNYDEVRDSLELTKQAASLLDTLQKSYDFRPEHSHLLRLLLDSHSEQSRLRTMLRQARVSKDMKAVGELTKAIERGSAALMKFYKDLGLLDRNATRSPFTEVQELRIRAVEFMKKHGMEKAYACQNCGNIQMVYALQRFHLEIDWRDIRDALDTHKEISKDLKDQIITLVRRKFLDINLLPHNRWVADPYTHPFLNDPDFPIWSPELRDIMHERCECGRPKLTMVEAARVLRISEVGLDQLLQQDNIRTGKPAVEGSGAETIAVFAREGSKDDSETPVEVGDESE